MKPFSLIFLFLALCVQGFGSYYFASGDVTYGGAIPTITYNVTNSGSNNLNVTLTGAASNGYVVVTVQASYWGDPAHDTGTFDGSSMTLLRGGRFGIKIANKAAGTYTFTFSGETYGTAEYISILVFDNVNQTIPASTYTYQTNNNAPWAGYYHAEVGSTSAVGDLTVGWANGNATTFNVAPQTQVRAMGDTLICTKPSTATSTIIATDFPINFNCYVAALTLKHL